MEDASFDFRLKALEEDSKRNQETHREFFARFERLGEAHARIDAQYTNIMATLTKLELAVEDIKAKPVKRWDGIVDKFIWASVAAVLGFVAARIGLV